MSQCRSCELVGMGKGVASLCYDCQEQRIAELEAGYQEAIDDIADWATYASEYFQEKHDLEGCINAHRALLQGAGDE